MKRIVFHVNGTKPEAEAACARLTASARSLGFEVLSAETVQAGAACDAAIVLGGDGTMLSAARKYAAAGVELLQYFRIVEVLGLSGNRILATVIGSVFDVKDIVCYGVGCVMLGGFELFRGKTKKNVSTK